MITTVVLGINALAGQGTGLRFDAVSVKENTGSDLSIRFEAHPPDGLRQSNWPLASIVPYAFDIRQLSRINGLPDWTRRTRYDISGRAGRVITDDERRAMLRAVLETDFQLKTHIESRDQTVYVLTAARADKRLGPGLKPRPECEVEQCASGGTGLPDSLKLAAVTLTQLADGMLSNIRREIVRDETGIPGVFDVTMSWRPDQAASDPNDARPSFFTAIQEQLGLKLEPQRRQVDVLIVDAITRPEPN